MSNGLEKKFVKPIVLSVKVRLRSPIYANFLDFYHKKSINDSFYKYLLKLRDTHKLLVTDETVPFKSHFNSEGFYFKTDICKCKNVIGKPCLIEDILDRDVILKLKISLYNFTSQDNHQIIGMSIHATEAFAKYDT